MYRVDCIYYNVSGHEGNDLEKVTCVERTILLLFLITNKPFHYLASCTIHITETDKPMLLFNH